MRRRGPILVAVFVGLMLFAGVSVALAVSKQTVVQAVTKDLVRGYKPSASESVSCFRVDTAHWACTWVFHDRNGTTCEGRSRVIDTEPGLEVVMGEPHRKTGPGRC